MCTRHTTIPWRALIAALLVSLALVPAAAAGPGPEQVPARDGVRLLSSSEEGVTLEVRVPWQEMRVQAAAEDDRYVRVSLPGCTAISEAGAPALPWLAAAIGVPFGTTLEVTVEAGPAHSQVLQADVVPAAGPRPRTDVVTLPDALPHLSELTYVVEQDPAVYGGAGAYPGLLAEVTGDGIQRQQRIAGIAAYPVQYNPRTRELTVYESLRVHVAFGDVPSTLRQAPMPESAAFEEVYRQALLNYESARAWRQATPPSPGPAGARSGDRPQLLGEGASWSPPVPGWRVKVQADGFYKLTYPELQSAGLPVDTLDPRTFQLFYLGSEAAIHVEGEEDGAFGPQDYVVFLGQGISSKYTRDNVYWLTYGRAQGARMAARDGTPGSANTPDHHVTDLFKESSTFYISSMPGIERDLEHWIWDYIYAPSRPTWGHTFSLPNAYGGAFTARLTVHLLGFLDASASPDHHAQIYLNGTLVDDLWWDGIAWQTSDVEFPQSLLVAGNNTLSVICPNDTGVGYDLVYVKSFGLEYAGTFTADGGELAFGYDTAGTWKYRVEGFAGNQLAAYDVTDPHAVEEIAGLEVIPSGAGYAALFEDEVTAPTGYRAVEATAYRSVQAIEQDTPSDLQATGNGADHIVLTHQAFWEQAGTLRDFRSSQGLRAVRVDVQDVYDEFGYGIVGIDAIHDFLAYAYAHWQAPAPSFVVLLGDGHYDPKNYYGYGRTNYVPAYLAPVDPWMGETAADNQYVTLVGDDLVAEMMLGRLAVNTTAEAAAVVNKAVAYEQSPEPGDWNAKVMAVADNADEAGDFAAISDDLLAGYLPAPNQADRVYYQVTHHTVAATRQAIQDGINNGRLIVNYVGHGASDQWAGEGLFTTDDVPLLQNGARLPVLVSMTCKNGYYLLPHPIASGWEAMAEVATRAEGRGALASWSPTGDGVVAGHHELNTGFFEAVFLDGLRGLGQATTAGKLKLWATGSNLDLLDTYLLFGDPATEINALEAGADLQVTKSVQPAGSVVPGDVLVYTLTFANAGPATAHGVVLTDPIPAQISNPKVIYMSPEVIGVIPGTTYAWEIAELPAGATGSVKVRGVVGLQTPPGAVVNEASIAGDESDPETGNNTASVSTTVQPVMRVSSIVVKYTQLAPGKYALTGQVRIADLLRAPVGGATVQVRWTLPDGATIDQQGVTDLVGKVNLRAKSTQTGAHQLCVTGVLKAGVVYLPSRNAETCDTVIIP